MRIIVSKEQLTKGLFKDLEELIKRILEDLKQQVAILDLKGESIQSKKDIEVRKVVKRKGIYIPIQFINHKILYEGFEISFLNSFLLLSNETLKNGVGNPFSQFALRTIYEMSFKSGKVIFNSSLKEEVRDRFKLFSLLVDFATAAEIDNAYSENFEKLLREFGHLLQGDEKKPLISLLEASKKGSIKDRVKRVKEARLELYTLQKKILNNLEVVPILKDKEHNLRSIHSSFSHLLHGNILLISDVFLSKRPNQLKLRVLWVLLTSSLNMANIVSEFNNEPTLKKSIESLNQDFKKIAERVKRSWDLI